MGWVSYNKEYTVCASDEAPILLRQSAYVPSPRPAQILPSGSPLNRSTRFCSQLSRSLAMSLWKRLVSKQYSNKMLLHAYVVFLSFIPNDPSPWVALDPLLARRVLQTQAKGLFLAHLLHFAVMSFVPQSRRRGQHKRARNHDGDERQPKQEKRMSRKPCSVQCPDPLPQTRRFRHRPPEGFAVQHPHCARSIGK